MSRICAYEETCPCLSGRMTGGRPYSETCSDYLGCDQKSTSAYTNVSDIVPIKVEYQPVYGTLNVQTGELKYRAPNLRADKIRSMSNNELAEFLRKVSCREKYGNRGVWDKHEIAGGKITPWEEWLESEGSVWE